jgi:hypothetical protein
MITKDSSHGHGRIFVQNSVHTAFRAPVGLSARKSTTIQPGVVSLGEKVVFKTQFDVLRGPCPPYGVSHTGNVD